METITLKIDRLDDAKKRIKDLTKQGYLLKDRRCKPVILKLGLGEYKIYSSMACAWRELKGLHGGIGYSTFCKRTKLATVSSDYLLARVYFDTVIQDNKKKRVNKNKC